MMTLTWSEPPNVYRVGDTIRFEGLNKRRAGRVLATGPKRLKVVYVCGTGSRFERFLRVDETHLTPEAVEKIGGSIERMVKGKVRPSRPRPNWSGGSDYSERMAERRAMGISDL
jgi:hypothetical protein